MCDLTSFIFKLMTYFNLSDLILTVS